MNLKTLTTAATIAGVRLPAEIAAAQNLVRLAAAATPTRIDWSAILDDAAAADDPQVIADAAQRHAAAELDVARQIHNAQGAARGRLEAAVAGAAPKVWTGAAKTLSADLASLTAAASVLPALTWEAAGRAGVAEALSTYHDTLGRVRAVAALMAPEPGEAVGGDAAPVHPSALALLGIVHTAELEPAIVGAKSRRNLDDDAHTATLRAGIEAYAADARTLDVDQLVYRIARDAYPGVNLSPAADRAEVKRRRRALAQALHVKVDPTRDVGAGVDRVGVA